LRLPKLEHPRLFWRKSEVEEIRARISRYPNLFRRYAEWLERMAPREGGFPERFLPPGLTRRECVAAAPEDMPAWQRKDSCGWRMYELGWRMLAIQFAVDFLKPESEVLQNKTEALRRSENTDRYNQFHHHGPFFPGAEASLVDLAGEEVRQSLPLWKQFEGSTGDMDRPAWTVVTLEEPLTAEKRALLYQMMMWENNAERYFETHRGGRAGTWWMNPYTGCHCPIQGYMLNFMFLRNLFGEPRLFEKPVFAGYLTFHHYADPISDKKQLQPERRGPLGEPWRWLMSALARHPAEKEAYGWEEWVKRMEGPLAGDEVSAVDKLMALEGRPLTGKLYGRTNYFVSGVSVPIALALGWYDPEAPAVKWKEAPPTTVFEVEGWAPMRSGWEEKATEVMFMSGVREHTARHKPNHFTIAKAGEYLIGTPVLLWDDGNNVGAWGNSVVVGDEWVEQWRMDLEHPRDGEHQVINRLSPSAWTYLYRDEALTRYRSSEQGFGAGLNLHGHTYTSFMNEGRLLAYQTWAKLDYVAGDAGNAWRAEDVAQLDRQLVFVKPDLVVVYDRVKLGPRATTSRWIAATGPELVVEGAGFRVRSGDELLTGQVLLPEQALLATPKPIEDAWWWRGQKLLEVAPARQGKEMEYLVVMRVGDQGGAGQVPELILDSEEAGLRWALGGRAIEVRFRRAGPVGGTATILEQGKSARYDLHEGIADSYAGWQSDPRYQQWRTDPAFSFVVPGSQKSD
jgi:hypothetical protein